MGIRSLQAPTPSFANQAEAKPPEPRFWKRVRRSEILAAIAAELVFISVFLLEELGLRDPPQPKMTVKPETRLHVECKNHFTLMGPPAPANLASPSADLNALVARPASRSRERVRRSTLPADTELFNETHIQPEYEK